MVVSIKAVIATICERQKDKQTLSRVTPMVSSYADTFRSERTANIFIYSICL